MVRREKEQGIDQQDNYLISQANETKHNEKSTKKHLEIQPINRTN